MSENLDIKNENKDKFTLFLKNNLSFLMISLRALSLTSIPIFSISTSPSFRYSSSIKLV